MVSWSLFFQRISDGLIICLCSSPAPTHLICCSFCLTSALYLAFKGLSLSSHNSRDVSLLTNCLSHTCTSMAMGPLQEASAVSCLIRTTCRHVFTQPVRCGTSSNRTPTTLHVPAMSVRVFALLLQQTVHLTASFYFPILACPPA